MQEDARAVNLAALSAGASDLDWEMPDLFDDSDDFDESEFPEEFWEQNRALLEAKKGQAQTFIGSDAGQVAVGYMSPELAEKIQQMVKGLGHN